jgi:prephenate dehydratase
MKLFHRSEPDATWPMGYLGPEGSHTHGAAQKLAAHWPHWQGPLIPYPSLNRLMAATESEEVALGLVPIENGLEGSVFEVLETLGLQKRHLQPAFELLCPIHHCLITADADPLEWRPITRVVSHPQALAQCRDTLFARLGDGIQLEVAASTSEAVRGLCQYTLGEVEGAVRSAAIGTRAAAERYGLFVQEENISDSPDNQTRFLVIHSTGAHATAQWLAPMKTACPHKTSFCLATPDKPGALVDVLLCFKDAGVNLTKIESRPAKRRFGEYVFYIDAEGDLTQPAFAPLMQALQTHTVSLQQLGPYGKLGLLE